MSEVARNHRRALVVLGCRVSEGRPSEALLRRLRRAHEVQERYEAELVIMSGGKAWGRAREADVMASWWLQTRGETAHTELRSSTTYTNALEVAKILTERGIRQVGLVTCDFHMARAAGHFRRRGFIVTEFAAPSSHTVGMRLRLLLREWGAARLEAWTALSSSRRSGQ